MAKVATRGTKLGSVLKCEFWADKGWCRKDVTVTLTPTSQIGEVIAEDSGVYALYAEANSPTNAAILIDADVEAKRPTSGTADVVCTALVKGQAIVAKEALVFAADVDDASKVDTALALLEAVNIVARTQV